MIFQSKIWKRLAPKGIIFSGGPSSVYNSGAPHFPDEMKFLK